MILSPAATWRFTWSTRRPRACGGGCTRGCGRGGCCSWGKRNGQPMDCCLPAHAFFEGRCHDSRAAALAVLQRVAPQAVNAGGVGHFACRTAPGGVAEYGAPGRPVRVGCVFRAPYFVPLDAESHVAL